MKHVAGFPSRAAAWCLAEGGISSPDAVAVGCLEQSVPADPRAELGFDCEWYFVEHHVAHLASAFFPSGFEDAAVLSVDAFGDGVSTMLARGPGLVAGSAGAGRVPALARRALHRRHAVARLPALRRRGEGDGPRAVRDAALHGRAAPARPPERRPVRARPRVLHAPRAPDGARVGGGHALRRPALLAEARGATRAGAPARGRAHRAPRGRRRVAPGRAGGALPPARAGALGADEAAAAVPRRRGRAERGRERPDPARDAVPAGLRAAGGERLGHRGRRGAPGRGHARVHDGARLLGAAVHGRGVRSSAGGGRNRVGAPRRGGALRARRRADRRRRRRRLVPGPDGVRAARAGRPVDPRRPAPARDQGRSQRPGQVPRAVPAVRAVRARRSARRSGSSRTTPRRSWCSSTGRAPTSGS